MTFSEQDIQHLEAAQAWLVLNNHIEANEELENITPPVRQFDGNDADAIAYVMRTNKRRNLNSGQWATIAVEADDIMQAIAMQVEKERREKISETKKNPTPDKKLSDVHANSTPTKAAELFNTNRTT